MANPPAYCIAPDGVPTAPRVRVLLSLLSLSALGALVWIVDRSCAYDHGSVALYTAYFLLHVALPGMLCVAYVKGGPVSWMAAIALGIPTGYALEIACFVALSAANAKVLLHFMPVLWLLAGAIWIRRHRSSPVDWRPLWEQSGITLALCVLMLLSALSTASHMYAESALSNGLPARGMFHDWVYLISRAGAIKHHWPFEDPSLAGESLQYHYFMLVHIAAASLATGVETSLLFLRFAPIPLGIVMVVQCFYLGRRMTHSDWGGVTTAVFTVVLSEVSFTTDFLNPAFLGYFSRWLYQSPTFFYGLVFYGALILVVYHSLELRHTTLRHYLWLALLAAAATGAKGTVLPPILLALGLLLVWSWLIHEKMPRRIIAICACLATAFIAVYALTMSAWATGEATIAPLYTMRISKYWQEHVALWQSSLEQWLPKQASANLAALACMLVVVVGTLGIRVLAFGYFLLQRRRHWTTLGIFLGLLAVITYVLGVTVHMNSYSQLYFLLLMRLPLSVLATACLVLLGRRIWNWYRREHPRQGEPFRPAALLRLSLLALAAITASVLVIIQANLWLQRCKPGFTRWLRAPSRIESQMAELADAMRWIRRNTETNAILIANAYTPENMRKDKWGALDHTKITLHFFYSALAERSLLVDGPTYSLQPAEAWRRMRLAAEIFYEKRYSGIALPRPGPVYLIVDRALRDSVQVDLPSSQRLFANARIEVYRLEEKGARPSAPPS